MNDTDYRNYTRVFMLFVVGLLTFCASALHGIERECRATTQAVKALHRHFHEKSKERGV